MEYFNLTKEEDNQMIDSAFADLMKAYSESNHKVKTELVTRAFEFARKAHEGVKRRSGVPYILHPIAVAKICVSEIGLGSTSICSALMHDVVEDTDFTVEDITNLFGDVIANIVDGLTKISGGIFAESASKQAENFQKLILTIPNDVRVIMIKMADRLHNMRTLDAMSQIKQQKITGETLFIYAPLAQRLGFFKIKTELENLCLKYQQPVVYEELKNKITALTPTLEKQFENFILPIREKLDKRNFKYQIIKRIKSPYSVYKKQITKNLLFEEIYDLLAVRIIITPNENDDENDVCWSVLGIVTSLYHEHPNRTRNWLSNPKPNGYKALHLTVMQKGDAGNWIEVQIRTKKMDDIAERGVAAHWKYKTGIQEQSDFDEWFQSIKELLAMEKIDTVALVDRFKMNLETNEIFIFTPKGEIKKLPVHATVLDFAFWLHSEIGTHCIGAQVDHKLVPITYELQNGEQVEVLTSKTQMPQPHWLDIVKTQKAQNAVKLLLRPQINDLRQKGRRLLEEQFKKLDVKMSDNTINLALEYFEYQKLKNFYVDLANGKIDVEKINRKVLKEKNQRFILWLKNRFVSSKNSETPLKIGKNKVLYITKNDIKSKFIKIAPCCKPILGDEIIGYCEDEKKVVIHKIECVEAQRLKAHFGNKIILVEWQKDAELSFSTTLSIEGIDRQGLLRQIIKIISEDIQINIKSINFDTTGTTFNGLLTIYVRDNEEVERIRKKLKDINSVKDVKRLSN
jgi:GTP pyrophosphokinase